MKRNRIAIAGLSLIMAIGGLGVAPAHADGADGFSVAGQATRSDRWPVLSIGYRGNTVAAIQQLLNGHGYPTKVDGIYGPATRASVLRYELDHGLYVNGVFGWENWKSMTRKDVLVRGEQGASVKALQLELNRVGHGVVVDGRFGRATYDAVRDIQASAGITVDGEAGSDTWLALTTLADGPGGH